MATTRPRRWVGPDLRHHLDDLPNYLYWEIQDTSGQPVRPHQTFVFLRDGLNVWNILQLELQHLETKLKHLESDLAVSFSFSVIYFGISVFFFSYLVLAQLYCECDDYATKTHSSCS